MRRNSWSHLFESTEGPTVTISMSRHVAEELMGLLGGALEMGDDDMGIDDMDPMGGGDDDLDLGLGDDASPDDSMDFGAGDDDEMPELPAGESDDDDEDSGGRPKAKKKSSDKKDDPKKDKEKKEESVRRLGAFISPARRR